MEECKEQLLPVEFSQPSQGESNAGELVEQGASSAKDESQCAQPAGDHTGIVKPEEEVHEAATKNSLPRIPLWTRQPSDVSKELAALVAPGPKLSRDASGSSREVEYALALAGMRVGMSDAAAGTPASGNCCINRCSLTDVRRSGSHDLGQGSPGLNNEQEEDPQDAQKKRRRFRAQSEPNSPTLLKKRRKKADIQPLHSPSSQPPHPPFQPLFPTFQPHVPLPATPQPLHLQGATFPPPPPTFMLPPVPQFKHLKSWNAISLPTLPSLLPMSSAPATRPVASLPSPCATLPAVLLPAAAPVAPPAGTCEDFPPAPVPSSSTATTVTRPAASAKPPPEPPKSCPYLPSLAEARRDYPPHKWGTFNVGRGPSGKWSVYCHPCHTWTDLSPQEGVGGFVKDHLQPDKVAAGEVNNHWRCLQGRQKRPGGRPSSTNSQNKNGGGKGGKPYREGPWSPEEDEILTKHVEEYGPRQWQRLREVGLLNRHSSSCKLRWIFHLRPEIFAGNAARLMASAGASSSGQTAKAFMKQVTSAQAVKDRQQSECCPQAVEVSEAAHRVLEGGAQVMVTEAAQTFVNQPAFGIWPRQHLGVTTDPPSTPSAITCSMTSASLLNLRGGEPSRAAAVEGDDDRLGCQVAASEGPQRAGGETVPGRRAGMDEHTSAASDDDSLEENRANAEELPAGQSSGSELEEAPGASKENEEDAGQGAEGGAGATGSGGADGPLLVWRRRSRKCFDTSVHIRGKLYAQLHGCAKCSPLTSRKTKDGCMHCRVPLCKPCFNKWHDELAPPSHELTSNNNNNQAAVPNQIQRPAEYGVTGKTPVPGVGVHMRVNLLCGSLKCIECWAATRRNTQHGCFKCSVALCHHCFQPWHERHKVKVDTSRGRGRMPEYGASWGMVEAQ